MPDYGDRSTAKQGVSGKAPDANDIMRLHGPDFGRAVFEAGLSPDLPPGNADERAGGDHRHVGRRGDDAALQVASPSIAINYDDFIAKEFPARELVLAPWLPMQGLAMIHSPRGVGKTHVALGIAWAIATGGGFLDWKAVNGARRVLFLDGEMPCPTIKDRLERVIARTELKPPLPDYLKIAAADYRPEGLPDLCDPEQQKRFYGPLVEPADCVLVDNLSTLGRSLKENDADSYAPMQAWVLSMRRAGKSVILFHHDGKGGLQRGTSKKEDVLDTVIGLRRPFDYTAGQGARFEVHFEKARGFHGPDAEPFEAWLKGEHWEVNPIQVGDDLESLRAMKGQGMSIRQIAARTGLSKSSVERRLSGG